jgi:hypothetical protein
MTGTVRDATSPMFSDVPVKPTDENRAVPLRDTNRQW